EGRDSRPGNGRGERAGRQRRWAERSTRAGTRVPATAPDAAAGHAGDAERSTRAGTRVPATGVQPGPPAPPASPALNEGRDSRPGNGWRRVRRPVRRPRTLNEG